MNIREIYNEHNYATISREIRKYVMNNKMIQTVNTGNGYLTVEQIKFYIKTIDNFLCNFDVYNDTIAGSEAEMLAPKSIVNKIILLKQVYKTIIKK